MEDLASNKIDVLVTCPINKDTIQSDHFQFPGHTEYLADMAGVDRYLMLLVSDEMRVGVATGHIPLKDVSKVLKSFLQFRRRGYLQTALLTYFIKNQLEQCELDSFKDVFFSLNTSQTGELSRQELLQAFQGHGYRNMTEFERLHAISGSWTGTSAWAWPDLRILNVLEFSFISHFL